ncbi:MAG: hypothetical protein IKB34_07405 [Clostridia bacterium]|nr:hypothetical protein [Clostridia bacterium]
MKECKGKRLLVLGGTHASLDVVRLAKEMGVLVVVTDEAPVETRVSKQIADLARSVSTTDMEGLMRLIKEDRIDGVFCGPSEFNIRNMIRLCALAGLPCYTTEELWNRCSNKTAFKEYCLKNGVPTPKEYPVGFFDTEGADDSVEYPVIVKPADSSSSRGVAVCYCRTQVKEAIAFARSCSATQNAFVEQYVDNGGRLFNVRYLLDNGEAYPYLALDTFIADPSEKRLLISALGRYPSDLTELYMRTADRDVRRMLSAMGLKNGTVFIQMIPQNGRFYCMDMGYRLSGGLFYKLTEPMMGINDVKMMIRYALGGKMCEKEDILRLDNRKSLGFAQLTVPLRAGRIAEIRGLDKVKSHPNVIDLLQYYREGDTVSRQAIGTLSQHFARISVIAESQAEVISAVDELQSALSILDEDGNEMYVTRFDTAKRLGGYAVDPQ